MTPQPGKQTVAIQLLRNLSRSKGNKTVKSGQLIEYSILTQWLFHLLVQLIVGWSAISPFRSLTSQTDIQVFLA